MGSSAGQDPRQIRQEATARGRDAPGLVLECWKAAANELEYQDLVEITLMKGASKTIEAKLDDLADLPERTFVRGEKVYENKKKCL